MRGYLYHFPHIFILQSFQVSLQPNGNDCGLYMIKYFRILGERLSFSREKWFEPFKCENSEIRKDRQVYHDLVTNLA